MARRRARDRRTSAWELVSPTSNHSPCLFFNGLPKMTAEEALSWMCPKDGESVNALHATRIENQFIWHPNRKHDNYDVYAAWDRTTCEEWKTNRSQYIITRVPEHIIPKFLERE